MLAAAAVAALDAAGAGAPAAAVRAAGVVVTAGWSSSDAAVVSAPAVGVLATPAGASARASTDFGPFFVGGAIGGLLLAAALLAVRWRLTMVAAREAALRKRPKRGMTANPLSVRASRPSSRRAELRDRPIKAQEN
jgi:hypothetical protein